MKEEEKSEEDNRTGTQRIRGKRIRLFFLFSCFSASSCRAASVQFSGPDFLPKASAGQSRRAKVGSPNSIASFSQGTCTGSHSERRKNRDEEKRTERNTGRSFLKHFHQFLSHPPPHSTDCGTTGTGTTQKQHRFKLSPLTSLVKCKLL